jgi:hypothetical protein
MEYGTVVGHDNSLLPAGSIIYTEKNDGTITATNKTTEGTNIFTFSPDKSSVAVEITHLEEVNTEDLNGIYNWVNVNVPYGEPYYIFTHLATMGYELPAGFEDTWGFNPTPLKFYANGSTDEGEAFDLIYYNNGSHAEAYDMDMTYVFDETAENVKLLFFGTYEIMTGSLKFPEEIMNLAVWEKKYTAQIDNIIYSFVFHQNGTADCYCNNILEKTITDLVVVRTPSTEPYTYGALSIQNELAFIMSPDANSCNVITTDGTSLGIFILEQ